MPSKGFEPTISAGERPKTYALDRAATGTGFLNTVITEFAAGIPWRTESTVGRDSSVGIATRYRLDVWGIKFR